MALTPNGAPAGYYYEVGATSYLIDPAGTYSLAGASAPTTDPAGTYSLAGASAPTTDPAGMYSVAEASAPTLAGATAEIQALPPTISGTVPGQTTPSGQPDTPFASVAITDPNIDTSDILSIQLSGGGHYPTAQVSAGSPQPSLAFMRSRALRPRSPRNSTRLFSLQVRAPRPRPSL